MTPLSRAEMEILHTELAAFHQALNRSGLPDSRLGEALLTEALATLTASEGPRKLARRLYFIAVNLTAAADQQDQTRHGRH